jgi:hypothetical protein
MRVLSLILMMTFLSHSAFGSSEQNSDQQEIAQEIEEMGRRYKLLHLLSIAHQLEELNITLLTMRSELRLVKDSNSPLNALYKIQASLVRIKPLDSDLTTRALEVLNLFNDLKEELEQEIQIIEDEDEDEELKAIEAEKKDQDQAAEVTSASSRSRLTTPSVNSVKNFLARLSPFRKTRVNPDA